MAQGSVSRFDPDKGFGFITADEGGADLFVHVSAVAGGGPLEVGQRVEFTPTTSDRGRQALDVTPVGGGAGALVEGTVSWYDADKGFGFLLPAGGGPDVFVHVTEITGGATLVPGQPVQFTTAPGPRGPQARQVFALGSGGARAEAAQRRQGTMSWFNADKGFGFLVPDDGEADVFVHVSQIAEDGAFIDEGERVEFDLAEGDRGLQAKAVRRVAGGGPATPPPVRKPPARRSRSGSFGRALGTVAWFDPGKGFGFLTPDDGAGDVFVHAGSLSGVQPSALEPGLRVDFEIVPGERGRTAEDVHPA